MARPRAVLACEHAMALHRIITTWGETIMSADPSAVHQPALPARSAGVAASAMGAPIPTSFWGYVKSFGPGIVLVLTWLGAGDLVDNAMAGAHYGYALMWGLALALLVRYFLVSIIA